MLDIIASIRSTRALSSTALTPAPPTMEEKDNSKGMSKNELAVTLQMCGQASTWKVTDLPAWIQYCAAKGTSEQYKLTNIQKYIMATAFYDDSDMSLPSPLLKMILNRAWTGKEGNVTRPSLLHAMEGLSPFTMLDLNADEVALLNSEEDLILSASVVSVSDLQVQRGKLKICIPSKPNEFMLMLKRYANLVYAFFSEACLLFKLLREVI